MCGATNSRLFFTARDRQHETPGEYKYRRCSECRSVYQDPQIIPDDLLLCYPAEYYTHSPIEDPKTALPFAGLRRSLRSAVVDAVSGRPTPGWMGLLGSLISRNRYVRARALALIPELATAPTGGNRALDIGCGGGDALAALHNLGWNVSGIEWDEHAAAVARHRSARQVAVGDFLTMPLERNAYDLVLMQHVIEHLTDPVGALRRIVDLLAPGGRAVLIYPNINSCGARRFGSDWFPWEPPRHLVVPDPLAIKALGRRLGLAVDVRSNARSSASFFAHSRSYARRGTVCSSGPSLSDHLAGAIEALLVKLGWSVGEEAVLILRKEL